MQEFMETYNNNVNVIENFLIETIKNIGSLNDKENSLFESLFEIFPSLDLMYACDEKNYLQITPNIYRDKTTQTKIGISREYLISRLNVNTKEISISKPYISAATGTTCITVAKRENGKIYFLDFDLLKLLQRLGLVEIQKQFNFISKSFYTLAAGILMVLAVFTIGYALFDVFNSIFIKSELSIESIFKPVIALTLGLAIFDLAKKLDKSPILINEAPGFVVNRILIPMINEAIEILKDGVATKEDIDKAMKLGAGHPMGPLQLADLIGLDVVLAIMETLYSETGDPKYRPSTLLKKYVRANLLGRKTKRGFYEYN
jgi:hypothetical protein